MKVIYYVSPMRSRCSDIKLKDSDELYIPDIDDEEQFVDQKKSISKSIVVNEKAPLIKITESTDEKLKYSHSEKTHHSSTEASPCMIPSTKLDNLKVKVTISSEKNIQVIVSNNREETLNINQNEKLLNIEKEEKNIIENFQNLKENKTPSFVMHCSDYIDTPKHNDSLSILKENDSLDIESNKQISLTLINYTSSKEIIQTPRDEKKCVGENETHFNEKEKKEDESLRMKKSFSNLLNSKNFTFKEEEVKSERISHSKVKKEEDFDNILRILEVKSFHF